MGGKDKKLYLEFAFALGEKLKYEYEKTHKKTLN